MGKDSIKAVGGKVCVNCRSPAKDLYKIYSSNVIKISECDNCKEISDKYVEFENVIVFIDLALLKTAAYRHVLFNTDFKKYFKYSIILICIEAYLLWNNAFTNTENLPHHADEKGFYISVLIVLLEHLVLFTVLYAFLRICATSIVPVKLLWKALTVSHFFSELLLIPTMIWRESSMWELGLNYVLIKGYSLLSMICSISVVSNISHFRTTLIILSAISIRHFSSSIFRPVINENFS